MNPSLPLPRAERDVEVVDPIKELVGAAKHQHRMLPSLGEERLGSSSLKGRCDEAKTDAFESGLQDGLERAIGQTRHFGTEGFDRLRTMKGKEVVVGAGIVERLRFPVVRNARCRRSAHGGAFSLSRQMRIKQRG